MDNDKFLADNHTHIQYLLHEEEAPTSTAYLPAGINRLEVQALQAPLEVSAYDANSKDLYSNLFQSTNIRVAGPYVKKFSRTKDGNKAHFLIRQHFMGDNSINRANDKAYLALGAAKYCRKLQRFTYETYVLIFWEEYAYFILE